MSQISLGKFKNFPVWLVTAFHLMTLTWAWLATVCHGISCDKGGVTKGQT
jgi:hypothetical protein